MRRLHGCDRAKGSKARNVGGLDDLDVLDPVARVPRAIGLHGGFIAVQDRAHRAVADRVHGDLQTAPVRLDRHFRELGLGEERFPGEVGPVSIAVDEISGVAFDHAVIKRLHETGIQPVSAIVVIHAGRLFQHGHRHEVLEMEGNLDAAEQGALFLHLGEQFQRVKISVHVVDRRDPVPGAPGQGGFYGCPVQRPFLWRWRFGRLASRGKPQRRTKGAGIDIDRSEGLDFAQFAGGEAVPAHDHLVAGPQGLSMEKPDFLEQYGVGPHRVMVEGHEGQRPVIENAVEEMPVDRPAVEHVVIGTLAEKDLRLRICRRVSPHFVADRGFTLRAREQQVIEDGAAAKHMHVRFDEARQHASAGSVDYPRRIAGKR